MRGRTNYNCSLEVIERFGNDDPSVVETSAGDAKTAADSDRSSKSWEDMSGYNVRKHRVRKWEDAYKEAFEAVSWQGVSLPGGFLSGRVNRDGAAPNYTYRATSRDYRFRLMEAQFRCRIEIENVTTPASFTYYLDADLGNTVVFSPTWPSGFGVSDLYEYRVFFEPYY